MVKYKKEGDKMKFTIEDKAMKRRRVKKADQKRLVYISLFFFVYRNLILPVTASVIIETL